VGTAVVVVVVAAAGVSLLLVVGDSVLVVLSSTIGWELEVGGVRLSKRLGHRWQGNKSLRAAAI